MVMLKENRVLLAKLEAAVGTPIALSATDGVFCVYDVDINPSIDFLPRPQSGGMSQLVGKTAGESCQLSFKLSAYGDGSGGVPLWASTFLPACGLVQKSAKIFTPSSKGIGVVGTVDSTATPRSLTMAVHEDDGGLKKQLFGAAGNVRVIFAAGQMVTLEFTFTGVWTDVADNATMALPDYPAEIPLSTLGTTMTWSGATVPCWSTIALDMGNEVSLRPCATQAKGFVSSIITNRKVAGTIDPESSQVATFDPYNEWTDGTTAALSIAVTDTVDNLTVVCPKVQIVSVAEADRNGMVTDNVGFQACANTDAGDDEISITFS